MSFDKTLDVRIFGVSSQNSTIRMVVGESVLGAFTRLTNPLRGTLLWDRCSYVLTGVSVSGGATGGSYSVYIETDAVAGYTGLPIAGVSIGPSSGLNSNRAIVVTNMHQSSASPLPTHINIVQHAAGGGIWLQCYALARQYRGTLGTPGGPSTAERILQGNMIRVTTNAADATFAIGTSASALGMHRMRMWDTALFWAVAGNSLSGTHDFHLIGRRPASGSTYTIARTGTGGTLAVAGGKRPLINLEFGTSPNPSHIIWDVVGAGGISDARVVALVKSGRGSLGKQ